MTALLTLDGVNAGYGSFAALFDISLDVEHGEAVGVVGPNGAGKTTLMRVISGLLPPQSGRILLEGESLAGAGLSRSRCRHRARAGESPAVSAPDRRRESAHGRLSAGGAPGLRRTGRLGL